MLSLQFKFQGQHAGRKRMMNCEELQTGSMYFKALWTCMTCKNFYENFLRKAFGALAVPDGIVAVIQGFAVTKGVASHEG